MKKTITLAALMLLTGTAFASNDKDAGYCAAYSLMLKKNDQAMQAHRSGDNKARTQNYTVEYVQEINKRIGDDRRLGIWMNIAVESCRNIGINTP